MSLLKRKKESVQTKTTDYPYDRVTANYGSGPVDITNKYWKPWREKEGIQNPLPSLDGIRGKEAMIVQAVYNSAIKGAGEEELKKKIREIVHKGFTKEEKKWVMHDIAAKSEEEAISDTVERCMIAARESIRDNEPMRVWKFITNKHAKFDLDNLIQNVNALEKNRKKAEKIRLGEQIAQFTSKSSKIAKKTETKVRDLLPKYKGKLQKMNYEELSDMVENRKLPLRLRLLQMKTQRDFRKAIRKHAIRITRKETKELAQKETNNFFINALKRRKLKVIRHR